MRCENCGTEIPDGRWCDQCRAGKSDGAAFLAFIWFFAAALAFLFVLRATSAVNGLGWLVVTIMLLILGLVEGLKAAGVERGRDGDRAGLGAVLVNGGALLGLAVFLILAVLNPPRKPNSLNNIKQLAIAVQTYALDNQDTFPGWVRNPDGRYAHNVWDEQIQTGIKSKGVYACLLLSGRGIRSVSQAGVHDRVLTYGLNGLLITPPKLRYDGDADFASVSAKRSPVLMKARDIRKPAETILFAELATSAPMPGQYGRPPDPMPYTWRQGNSTAQWQGALAGWIDISPREYCEPTGQCTGSNAYDGTYSGYQENGIARTLYGGGGVYAFCDGHAQFMKIAKSVGIGTTVKGTFVTAENCWEPWNTNNMWNPHRAGEAPRAPMRRRAGR